MHLLEQGKSFSPRWGAHLGGQARPCCTPPQHSAASFCSWAMGCKGFMRRGTAFRSLDNGKQVPGVCQSLLITVWLHFNGSVIRSPSSSTGVKPYRPRLSRSWAFVRLTTRPLLRQQADAGAILRRLPERWTDVSLEASIHLCHASLTTPEPTEAHTHTHTAPHDEGLPFPVHSCDFVEGQ